MQFFHRSRLEAVSYKFYCRNFMDSRSHIWLSFHSLGYSGLFFFFCFIFHKELEGFFTANGYAVHPWSLLKQTVVPSPFYFFVNFTFMHQLIYQFFVFRFCYIDFEKRPNYFVVLRELFKRTGEVRLNKIFPSKWSLINNYGVHRITQTNKANP